MFDFDDEIYDNYVKQGYTDEQNDELCDYFANHPLTMKQCPDPEKIEDNENLLAIQHIIYDEDAPDENALQCLQRGTDILKKYPGKKSGIRQALKAYEDGILQQGSNQETNAKLYSNIAHCQHQLQQYGKCIENSKLAIQAQPTFLKPYWRLANAQLVLKKYQESLESVNQGLKIDAKNKELLEIKKKCQLEIEEIKKQEQIQQQKDKDSKNQLYIRCRQKQIQLGHKKVEIPGGCKGDIYFDEQNEFHTPIVIYYPQFSQLDYIQDAYETDCLGDHMYEILKQGLPWDDKKEYTIDNVEVYIEQNEINPIYDIQNKLNTNKKGMKQVDLGMSIYEVVSSQDYVMPFMLEIYVVSKQSTFFYAKFKKEHKLF